MVYQVTHKYPSQLDALWREFKSDPTGDRRVEWLNMLTTTTADKLWLIARQDPIEGFRLCIKMAIYTYLLPTHEITPNPRFLEALEMVSRFCEKGGRLTREDVLRLTQDALGAELHRDGELYSKFAFHLVYALEYADRVNKHPGWYPPTAYELWRTVRENHIAMAWTPQEWDQFVAER